MLAADFPEHLHVTFKPPVMDDSKKKKSEGEAVKELTLADTLNAFIRAEKLGPDDPWYVLLALLMLTFLSFFV